MSARAKIDNYLPGAALFILIFIAAIKPIASYDYFWHLTAGRWIIDHHTLPLFDPLAIASAHIPWINGEWLYELALAPVYTLIGHGGICVVNAMLIASIFTLAFWFAAREQDRGVALFIAATAFAGAAGGLGVRPAVLAALLLVISLGLLSSQSSIVRLSIFYACLSALWINIHPSALLAPLLALATLFVDLRRGIVALVSACALLVNPYGWHALTAPIQLVRAIRRGAFINVEWVPSFVQLYPLLYLTLAGAVILFLCSPLKQINIWRLLILIALSVLACRYRRNQGLYFAALPLLVSPLRALPSPFSKALGAAALVPILWVFTTANHGPGINNVRLPVRAGAALQSSGLAGNIYNPDQFGGFLEWTFYPDRRVLTDGRDELFLDYIVNHAKARTDFEIWKSFLANYDVTIAIDDYHAANYTLPVDDAVKGERRMIPYSLILYPRRDWALIAFDDAAMIFAKRDAFSPEKIASIEYRYIVPDHPTLRFANAGIRAAARAEVARARQQFGDIAVVRDLERGLDQ